MGFFNLGVGIERGFITRDEGVARALLELRFLSRHAQRFHGAFPHLVNGQTGRVIPFGPYDDGADLVETAFLIQGALFAREYFSRNDPEEAEIRNLADGLWRDVQWDWFLSRNDPFPVLIWHWSPDYGWKINLHIVGFNECQIVYLLAMASPTHPISPAAYWQGWEGPDYASDQEEFGINLELGNIPAVTPPLFMAHYSYLGLDPRQIRFHGRTYFDHFTDFCRVQISYAQSKSNVFKGYGPLWGITASAGLDLGVPDAVKAETLAYLVVVLEGMDATRVADDVEALATLLSKMGALEVYVLPAAAGAQLIAAREKAFFAAKASGADDIIDAVVPRAAIPDYLARVAVLAGEHGALITGCGHVGDGNVHLSVFQPDSEGRHALIRSIFAAAVAAGGAISGEHGIGTEKQEYYLDTVDPTALALMRSIKAAFDPRGILGPHRLLDPTGDAS